MRTFVLHSSIVTLTRHCKQKMNIRRDFILFLFAINIYYSELHLQKRRLFAFNTLFYHIYLIGNIKQPVHCMIQSAKRKWKNFVRYHESLYFLIMHYILRYITLILSPFINRFTINFHAYFEGKSTLEKLKVFDSENAI